MAAPLPADPFPAPDPFASGFPFGDYSKGLQRYPGDLPCLGPRSRLSAPPSTAAASQRARNRAQFGDASQTILLSNNNDFEHDGRIEIDSNTVERAMRPVVLTRQNALFAGSDEGAANWAILASLIETCKLHGVNPEAYFTDVLTKLVNNWPNRRLAELLPWAWNAGPH